MNGPAIGLFRQAVGRLWRRVLLRRSQTHCLPWRRMHAVHRPVASARPHLSSLSARRLGVITQGKSRMR